MRQAVGLRASRQLEKWKLRNFFPFKRNTARLSILPMVRIYPLALLFIGLDVSSAEKCSDRSRQAWRSSVFTREYENCCTLAAALGVGQSVTQCLRESVNKHLGVQLEEPCARCFKTAFLCVLKNCKAACARDSGSPECMTCTDNKCNGALMECTGVRSKHELPPPPQSRR